MRNDVPSSESFLTVTHENPLPFFDAWESEAPDTKAMRIISDQLRTYSYLRNAEILSLDMGEFDYFHIKKLSRSSFRLANGQAVAAFEASYKLGADAILEKAKAKGRYDPDTGEISKYFKAIAEQEKRLAWLISLPISEGGSVYFYSRTEPDENNPSLPTLRWKYFVFGVRRENANAMRRRNILGRISRILKM